MRNRESWFGFSFAELGPFHYQLNLKTGHMAHVNVNMHPSLKSLHPFFEEQIISCKDKTLLTWYTFPMMLWAEDNGSASSL